MYSLFGEETKRAPYAYIQYIVAVCPTYSANVYSKETHFFLSRYNPGQSQIFIDIYRLHKIKTITRTG